MASQSQGIQQLLQAEKRAAEKVADARKSKPEVEQATRRQVQGMQSSQQRNRERVLAQLLGMVCEVRPQLHPNYRITA
ncbi:V-type proton ATPase subunit G 2 isoform 2-T2 [Ctenodactylus gundi]